MQDADENTSGMCKAMREIQEDFAEKDRLISRYQQENSRFQEENARLKELLKANGIQYQ